MLRRDFSKSMILASLTPSILQAETEPKKEASKFIEGILKPQTKWMFRRANALVALSVYEREVYIDLSLEDKLYISNATFGSHWTAIYFDFGNGCFEEVYHYDMLGRKFSSNNYKINGYAGHYWHVSTISNDVQQLESLGHKWIGNNHNGRRV